MTGRTMKVEHGTRVRVFEEVASGQWRLRARKASSAQNRHMIDALLKGVPMPSDPVRDGDEVTARVGDVVPPGHIQGQTISQGDDGTVVFHGDRSTFTVKPDKVNSILTRIADAGISECTSAMIRRALGYDAS